MANQLPCRQSANTDLTWSSIEEDEATIQTMRELCHSQTRLHKSGYTTSQLSREKLLEKLRCENCTRPIFQSHKKNAPKHHDDALAFEELPNGVANPNYARTNYHANGLCTYHPQDVSRGSYRCCGTRIFTPKDKGCFVAPSHAIHPRHPKFLEEYWLYYTTSIPTMASARSAELPNNIAASERIHQTTTQFHTAVVMDCEFGVNKYSESELIRLTAIDFFSKKILIDELVIPTIRMKHYSTKYSGIRKFDIDNARATGTGLFGRDRAREALLRFVGPDTILIVHGGPGDMNSLRLIHPMIIDTFVLDSMLFEPTEGGRGLKNLCKKLLGIDVQVGKFGHDSVEDSLACRELFLCQMEYLPDDFAERITLMDNVRSEKAIGKQGAANKWSNEVEDEPVRDLLGGFQDDVAEFETLMMGR